MTDGRSKFPDAGLTGSAADAKFTGLASPVTCDELADTSPATEAGHGIGMVRDLPVQVTVE